MAAPIGKCGGPRRHASKLPRRALAKGSCQGCHGEAGQVRVHHLHNTCATNGQPPQSDNGTEPDKARTVGPCNSMTYEVWAWLACAEHADCIVLVLTMNDWQRLLAVL